MKLVIILITSFAFAAAAPARAQHEHPEGGDLVGTAGVSFQTSCAPALRQDFNRAVALLHSFWFAQAIAAFNGVLEKDPSCAIAHWGIALSRWGNPFAGLEVISADRPRTRSHSKGTGRRLADCPRTRLYRSGRGALHRRRARDTTRAHARLRAGMERLVQEFPADMEARIFYALAANQTAQTTDKKYSQQLKAAAILEPLFKEHPKHPGLAHYIIHAYDHPPLAAKALPAARSYASFAPSVPHALHMPSHTFTRVGLWKESIETNRRSAEAARKEKATPEELHAMDYQTYAYLQIATGCRGTTRRRRSNAAAARLDVNATGAAAPGVAGVYASAAIPARYALERGAWAEAAALTVRRAPFLTLTRSVTSRARSAPRARAIQRPPRPTSSNSPRFGTR